MGTIPSWRKAYGALKDTTTVSLAKVNSEFKDLDVAVVKATNHVECPPKERHVRKVFAATSANRPRADVSYCVHALARRLSRTCNWVVALKTLIVIHRTLREGDATFREELLHYCRKAHILQISYFKDDSSALAWDCSAWVRSYALFLEERLECFRILRYDIEAECLRRSSEDHCKLPKLQGYSRTRSLGSQELLEHLPALQQLLFRLVGCQPEGASFGNYLVQYALALVLKESFKIYCAINDGIINLVDLFFEMSRHEAIKALSIYKRAGQLAKNLAEYYELCKALELARNFQFPTLREPLPSFIATMEEYIREAPKLGTIPSQTLEYEEENLLTDKMDEQAPSEILDMQTPTIENSEPSLVEPIVKPKPVAEVPTQLVIPGDLLGLDEMSQVVAALEESNALALAIIPSGDSRTTSTSDLFGIGDSSAWELALVTTSSNNENQLAERKMAGGFDKLLLDSLYDEAARKQQNTIAYGGGLSLNPSEFIDPFAMSNNIAPPPHAQMALTTQKQQQFYQHPNMITQPNCQPPYSHPQILSSNPFGDPFNGYPQAATIHGSSSLI